LLLCCCCLLAEALAGIRRGQQCMHLTGCLLEPAPCGKAPPWPLLPLAGAWRGPLACLRECLLPVLPL
jgi:hypothetical protein